MRLQNSIVGGYATALSICAVLAPPHAMADVPNAKELLNMSLEQLSNLEVTSVSKRSEKASEAAAAIHVITQEDIRRSGATAVPELFRMVPGMNVARAGSRNWAVSVRGFNDQFSNKLLVLIDGRTVYTTLFSGTYWDTQDLMLEDIERIEVIRGPGATLWGANAVNGVINIITKSAKDTQGGLVSAQGGTFDRGALNVRYGGTVDNTHYRMYARSFDRDEVRTMTNLGADDALSKHQVGFRSDTKFSERDALTVQGDFYNGREDIVFRLPLNASPFTESHSDTEHVSGGNILSRWSHALQEGGEITLQTYYDEFERDSRYYIAQQQQTFDIDFQHSFSPHERHQVVWGTGYRLVKDDTDGNFRLYFTPDDKVFDLFSAFFQDRIALVPESVYLTLGSKFEQNDFTGFEFQPSGRISWLIDDKQMMWASVSRALRTPSRTVDGLSLYASAVGAAYLKFGSNRNADSEELVAYEAGYRVQPVKDISIDVAGFYNGYDRLINLAAAGTAIETGLGAAPRAVIIQNPNNTAFGRTWGGELSATWQALDAWQLSAAYSLLHMNLSGSSLVTSNGKSPQHQFNVRSYAELTEDVQFDTFLYYVDRLRPSSTLTVPDYLRLDLRLVWQPMDSMELSLVGQNLLDSQHPEFSAFLYNNQVQIPRSVYAGVRWWF